MENTFKIVLLQPELTWVIHRIDSITKHKVYSVQEEIHTYGDITDLRGIIKDSPKWNLKKWIPGQEKMIQNHPEVYPKEKIWQRTTDGFLIYKPNEETTLAIVPPDYREELITKQHHDLCHAGFNKVYSSLYKH